MVSVTTVCVFCGSSTGRSPAYATVAAELGGAIARRGMTLVYGGGNVGLMGVVADAALGAGGRVVGVITEALVGVEIGHDRLTELKVVGSMHERKALMADLAEAVVALPGGFGTLEELFEIVTWGQLGYHTKPAVVLDVDGFYGPMFEQVERAVAEGFIRPEHAALLRRASTVEAVLAALDHPVPTPIPKWIDRGVVP